MKRSIFILFFLLNSISFAQKCTIHFVALGETEINLTINRVDSLVSLVDANYFFFCDGLTPLFAKDLDKYSSIKKKLSSYIVSPPNKSKSALTLTSNLYESNVFSRNKIFIINFYFDSELLEIYDYEKNIVNRFLIINKFLSDSELSSNIEVKIHILNSNQEKKQNIVSNFNKKYYQLYEY